MPWLLILSLGALQGITEFLPVSSSGHLRIVSAVFGVDEPQTFFDIMLHVGTLVAVVVVYHQRFAKMVVGVWAALRRPTQARARFAADPDLRLAVFAICGTVPTGMIAIAVGDRLEGAAASLVFVGTALIVNGGILLLLRALTIGRLAAAPSTPRRGLDELRLSDALIVGTAQGFGIVRGISRSGSTITTGLLTGLNQEASAALSFILSVPAICGALVLKVGDASGGGDLLLASVVGAAAAAVVGILALRYLLRLLQRGQLHHFAWYCFALGATAIAWELLDMGS